MTDGEILKFQPEGRKKFSRGSVGGMTDCDTRCDTASASQLGDLDD